MTKMTIHRALAELKLYDKKIYDLMNEKYVVAEKTRVTKIDGLTRKEFEDKTKQNLQALNALIRNRQNIKRAIAKSNDNTFVTIGGKTMTILDAIELKNFSNTQRQIISIFQSQYNKANSAVKLYEDCFQTNLERYITAATKETSNKELIETLTNSYKELNEVSLVDACNLGEVIKKMQDELDTFLTEVDYVLSESNSTTFIEVELEG